jgi:hypothetical protein
VIYDKRFQQLSTDLFSTITECQVPNSNCNIDLILSTLSAHSFNFVATNVGQGVHTLAVSWVFECTGNGGTMEPCDTTAFPANSAGACVGPGSLTVTQTKAFSQSGGITLQ